MVWEGEPAFQPSTPCALSLLHVRPPQLPTKKERSAVEAVEAVLETERREAKAREARHKLTVERLRRQLVEAQVGPMTAALPGCCLADGIS